MHRKNNQHFVKGEFKLDKKCEKCGGELIEGKLGGAHMLSFYPKDAEKKLFRRKYSSVVCYCCKSCGLIQNFKAINLDKII